MRRNLRDQVVVITGASSGIGKATAIRMARRKASLILASRDLDTLNVTAADCARYGANVVAVATDTGKLAAVERLAYHAFRNFGRIDVWINNAGTYLMGPFEEVPYAATRQVFETNLFGYIHGSRVAVSTFREQGHGTLINIASVLANIAASHLGAYASCNAAIAHLSECLRQELSHCPKIHVSTLFTGSADTPMYQHAANYSGYSTHPVLPVTMVDLVADRIVQLTRKPVPKAYVGQGSHLLTRLHNLWPQAANHYFNRRMQKASRSQPRAFPTQGNLFSPMLLHGGTSGNWLEVKRNRWRHDPLRLLGGITAASLAMFATLPLLQRNSRRLRRPSHRHVSQHRLASNF